jgi:translation initiation factor 2 gamma subunit (eIF-2gamma)
MLSELYEKLGIKDEIDPKFVQAAIFSGNVWGLKWKYPGLFDIDETESAVVTEVVDILNIRHVQLLIGNEPLLYRTLFLSHFETDTSEVALS